MRAFVGIFIAVLFSNIAAAELPFPCPVSGAGEAYNPSINADFNNGERFPDGSVGYYSRLLCRDRGGQVLMWTWISQNCPAGNCDAARYQDEVADTKDKWGNPWFPRHVPHVCVGCVATRSDSTGLPLPCPVTVDPLGWGRPPFGVTYGWVGAFGSSARFNTIDCRVDKTQYRAGEGTVAWIWEVKTCPSSGPCWAAQYPATEEGRRWLPPDVANVCRGCYSPRRRAVRH